MDYYRVLEVSRTCTRDDLHKAFRRLSKQYHPDRFPEAERERAEKHYQTIVIAFNTLKDSRLRARHDKTLASGITPKVEVHEDPATNAQRHYKMGLARYNAGNFEQAIDALNRSIYFKESSDAWYYKGMAESRVSGRGKDAVKSIEKALSLNAKNVEYHHGLIQLLMRYGLKTRAKGVVARARQLFPKDEKLAEMAAELDPEDAKKEGRFKKKGGLLGGIFGKK
ncbi:J domain-containing protein [Sulfidibacter corallicola]|uniref:J domain-containing protein n=1 Tax=Sulfidibacter corallicola TaxID=2818388 RepID=A0A8A4TVL0_SULCO|nr:J domain-containing protein [Sulfidibacter corallicola]QTD53022.1 J domain-containing protein [Sulfidibacter corallicola]